VALAVVLLVCAGLMIRTFQQLNDVDPVTYALVSVILIFAAALASYVPS
jgi:hypothetical protein